jgi:hypothetical protein
LFGAEHFQRVAFVVSIEDSFPHLASATESNEASQSVGPEEISYFDHRKTCRCEQEANWGDVTNLPPLPCPKLSKPGKTAG